MPKLHYALEPNAPKRLELAWESHYRDFVVKLDGLLQRLPAIRRLRRTDAPSPSVVHPAR